MSGAGRPSVVRLPSVAASCEAGRPVRKMIAYPSLAAWFAMSTMPGTAGNNWPLTNRALLVGLKSQLLYSS